MNVPLDMYPRLGTPGIVNADIVFLKTAVLTWHISRTGIG